MSRAPRLLAVLLASLVLLAGCASSSRVPAGVGSPSSAASASQPAPPCARLSCRPGAVVALTGGYGVRLWQVSGSDGTSSAVLSSTPVLELVRSGAHQQWWPASMGFAWTASLTCLSSGPEPNCAVMASEGAHAGSAELVVLRGGRLVASPEARVVFDSGAPHAVDLDHDGYLDIIGVDNDYRPNFAAGHNFWATYRFHDSVLTETGCAPQLTRAASPPTQFLHGPCPRPAGASS